ATIRTMSSATYKFIVMAGLGPDIHALEHACCMQRRGCPGQAGHDEEIDPVWTSYAPARSSMACSSTSQPAARSLDLASSSSLWLKPPAQGTKIMPTGAVCAT